MDRRRTPRRRGILDTLRAAPWLKRGGHQSVRGGARRGIGSTAQRNRRARPRFGGSKRSVEAVAPGTSGGSPMANSTLAPPAFGCRGVARGGRLAAVATARGEPVGAPWIVVAAVCCYLVAYRYYSLFIATA
jgi:hypothetical protein